MLWGKFVIFLEYVAMLQVIATTQYRDKRWSGRLVDQSKRKGFSLKHEAREVDRKS